MGCWASRLRYVILPKSFQVLLSGFIDSESLGLQIKHRPLFACDVPVSVGGCKHLEVLQFVHCVGFRHQSGGQTGERTKDGASEGDERYADDQSADQSATWNR